MKISASIIDCKDSSIEAIVKELDLFGIDYLHIDCIDDKSVIERIPKLRSISSTAIDLHLIAPHPSRYYADLLKLDLNCISFQVENLREDLTPPPELKARIGLAITNNTPIDAFAPYSDRCSFVLLMTTEPGKSGGKFNRDTFERIREFRRKFPGKRIHVDGGVDDQISFALRQNGVHCCVSGSFITKAPNPATALLRLRVQSDGHDLRVRDFMMTTRELPVVNEKDLQHVAELLQAINEARMGLALVVDSSGQLVGIATDGDLRRAFLRHHQDFNAVTVEDALNRNPRSIDADATVAQLMEQVKADHKTTLFFPVVDKQSKLLGLVPFTDLIKGES